MFRIFADKNSLLMCFISVLPIFIEDYKNSMILSCFFF